jgi:adenine/guanine phosphoribosyltransferase-like PRPP-binding protein
MVKIADGDPKNKNVIIVDDLVQSGKYTNIYLFYYHLYLV